MEYDVRPAGDREVTVDLLRRFLRTAELLRPGIQSIITNENGAEPVSARIELPNDPTAKSILNLASIDGFQMVPVPEEPKKT